MNSITYFEIQASEPANAAGFYKNVFGWEFRKEEFQPVEYWRMHEASGIFGAILKRPAPAPAPGSGTNAFTCSVEVDSFDQTAQKILDNGGRVALPKFAVPGRCWQGYFLDIDNNAFGIFEADTNAK
ncbi:MAG TPA: VOC family protein [Bryobacteraceae bacterium]|jgi:hypothetical protein